VSIYQFSCKCGAQLMIVGKRRPNCRNCGKQMSLAGKVGGPVMYAHIDSFNRAKGKEQP